MHKPQRPQRAEVKARAAALVERNKRAHKPPFERYVPSKPQRPAPLIAYDFETTRIAVGTPRPLYLTAYGQGFELASPVHTMQGVRNLLRHYFLVPENYGTRFVAWHANGFDVYFVVAALLGESDLRIKPYLTRTKSVRGVRVTLAADGDKRTSRWWEFDDGMAMLGLAGVSLAKFLATFAPDHAKLVGVVDFDKEEFDPDNPRHCEYALRDSVGLWHGMTRAQAILLENFGQPLRVTMGGACIRIFQAHIPEGVKVLGMDSKTERLTREYVMRGGFCYCARRYKGPVWKYDINQAYAAAMRDAALPQGELMYYRGLHKSARVYIARVTATHPTNTIPFYYRTEVAGRIRSVFDTREIRETWLTSIEVDQLRAEGWSLQVLESYQWADSFNMRDYVDRLERIRTTCEGGPKGPIGTMTKAVGNHSYGKTVEALEPIDYVLAPECPEPWASDDEPEGWAPFYGDEGEPLDHVFFRFTNERRPKAYHKVQLGAFITAHVRMVLRRAALLAPDAWLYADTDCVVFSKDVGSQLDLDPARYGAWKVEESGAVYRIIAKKVYSKVGDKESRSAKGLHVGRLSDDDFEQWFEGSPPVQVQVQRQNFLAVMRGADMFRSQERHGTAVETRAEV